MPQWAGRNLFGYLTECRRYFISLCESQKVKLFLAILYQPQTPVRQIPRWKRGRGDLNQESRDDDVSHGDAINLSSLQLLEEAAHNILLPAENLLNQRLEARIAAERIETRIDLNVSDVVTIALLVSLFEQVDSGTVFAEPDVDQGEIER
jgi:hypothetical protein